MSRLYNTIHGTEYVSPYGPTKMFSEFAEFCKNNHIFHVTTVQHHTWNRVCPPGQSCFSLHLTHNNCSIQDFFHTDFIILEGIKFIILGPSWETNGPWKYIKHPLFMVLNGSLLCSHTHPSWICILTQTNQYNPPTNYNFEIHLDTSLTCSHSFMFSIQFWACIFHPHMCATWPTHISPSIDPLTT
jgi:hypothetical protein